MFSTTPQYSHKARLEQSHFSIRAITFYLLRFQKSATTGDTFLIFKLLSMILSTDAFWHNHISFLFPPKHRFE
jgi:hypothetical protein